MMGWYDGGGMGAGGWIVMVVSMTIFWGLVVAAGIMIFRGSSDRGRRTDADRLPDRARDRDAMEILDERFARGELDAEEYEARRAVLRGGRQ